MRDWCLLLPAGNGDTLKKNVHKGGYMLNAVAIPVQLREQIPCAAPAHHDDIGTIDGFNCRRPSVHADKRI